MQKRFFCFFILVSFLYLPLQSQPKRELRGVWLTTYFNLDWPSKAGLSSSEQKKELLQILDELHKLHFNALFFQVRGAGDALYPSAYVPWSRVLSGQEGTPPDPLYDPLAFALKEAQKRGIEFHAWMNPFRIDQSIREEDSYPPLHIYRQHPEWCIPYGGKLYLDPGIPEARYYLVKVVAEVAKQYEVDGVHFDDYFYPYPFQNQPFPDSSSFQSYNPDSLSLEDWRRNNINLFMESVRDELVDINSEIKFGVSPFGVWRNRRDDPRGSASQAGIRSYDVLFADVLKWIEEGWLDYVAPQIYFSTQLSVANYRVLLDWWKKNQGAAELYVGHALYKVGNNSDNQWNDPSELGQQIALARKQSMGSVLFRYKFLPQNPLGVKDSLEKSIYSSPALLPMRDHTAPKPLFPIIFSGKSKKGGIRLSWEQEREKGDYYAIYKIREKQAKEKEEVEMPIFALHKELENTWVDSTTRLFKKYRYQITHLDRFHQESSPTYELSIRHRWGWKKWWKGLFKRKNKSS